MRAHAKKKASCYRLQLGGYSGHGTSIASDYILN